MGFMVSMTAMPWLVRDVIVTPCQKPKFIRIVLAMVNFHLQEARLSTRWRDLHLKTVRPAFSAFLGQD